jgi:flagellar motor switch protein FliN/FliY
MAQWPDDEQQQPGSGDGEPISQEALDALLAASANVGEVDDSNAFDAFGETQESDLEFGLGEETEEAADAMLGGMAGEIPADSGMAGMAADMFGGASGAVDFSAFQMADIGSAAAQPENADFLRVRDIPLEVSVELGRTKLLIKDILDLSTGAIIELDKIAGEPVDLFANGLLVARGEVIVIDDNFGVRITEIITAEDRIKEQYAQSLAA